MPTVFGVLSECENSGEGVHGARVSVVFGRFPGDFEEGAKVTRVLMVMMRCARWEGMMRDMACRIGATNRATMGKRYGAYSTCRRDALHVRSDQNIATSCVWTASIRERDDSGTAYNQSWGCSKAVQNAVWGRHLAVLRTLTNPAVAMTIPSAGTKHERISSL